MAEINAYTRGTLVRAQAVFANAAGTLVVPTSVTFRVRAPDGTVTTPAVSNPSTGVYTTDIDANAEGDWHWRAEGTGAYQGAAEKQFTVTEGRFG